MKNWLILISIPLFLFSCSFIQSFTSSNSEKQVNKTLNSGAKICMKKFGVRAAGEGASMPGGIVNSLFLSFDYSGILKKNEIRAMIVGCATELLNAALSNKDLQGYLKSQPITIDNIDIDIFIHDNKGNYIYDPNIFVADIRNGIITYKTRDPKNDFKYISITRETYAEALKLLEEQKGP